MSSCPYGFSKRFEYYAGYFQKCLKECFFLFVGVLSPVKFMHIKNSTVSCISLFICNSILSISFCMSVYLLFVVVCMQIQYFVTSPDILLLVQFVMTILMRYFRPQILNNARSFSNNEQTLY